MFNLYEQLRILAEGDLREYARDSLIGVHPDQSELREWAALMDRAADEIAHLTTERDKTMVEVNAADARVVAVARENCDLKREIAKGGDRVYAPDGRTWQAFAYSEAAKRGELEVENDRLRALIERMEHAAGDLITAARPFAPGNGPLAAAWRKMRGAMPLRLVGSSALSGKNADA